MITRTMFQRHKLEKAEGKSYNEAGVCHSAFQIASTRLTGSMQVSAEMKVLNSKFARLHGYSSLANLSAVIACIFHGLWIGNKGLGAL